MPEVSAGSLQLEVPIAPEFAHVLSVEALQFVAQLEHAFGARRRELLAARSQRQLALRAGQLPQFPKETEAIRSGEWRVADTPADLQDRRVEITGPVDRKMVINALNSGARMFMADFEDSNSPTWHNNISGQLNLMDAVRRTIAFEAQDGRSYKLNAQVATLLVRPRGWHLEEKHALLNGKRVSASLFDFGLYFFHNAHELLARKSGPYFYIPKLEGRLEARLWNDVFVFAQQQLGLPPGTIRATVLIENILAAFEMPEILYELRAHCSGLNAGRWDYIFSVIRKLHGVVPARLPDRAQITMTVPFMRAYTELLVKTCHAHGAHAIGGMAAFIPSRKDAEVNRVALERVRDDKQREAADGFDGTWVAHPDLVPVAQAAFDAQLGTRPHQKERLRSEVDTRAAQLLELGVPGGTVTEAGLRNNISVALQYIAAWLGGVGCVPIYNLMEDAATAEISRSQLWQWTHQPDAKLADGRSITPQLYRALAGEQADELRATLGAEAYTRGNFLQARQMLDELVLTDEFADFLTLGAYARI